MISQRTPSLHAIALDIEIEKAVPPRSDVDRIPDIEYCGGWDDQENMGIASLVVTEALSMRTEVFMKDNYEGLRHVISAADHVITFNGWKFDGPLLEKTWGIEILPEQHVDLLRLIWQAAGNDPDVFAVDTHAGYGLDAVCRANGLPGKINYGAHAPVMFQRGEYGTLLTYNIDDVWKTLMLAKMVRDQGWLFNPREPSERLYFDVPPFELFAPHLIGQEA